MPEAFVLVQVAGVIAVTWIIVRVLGAFASALAKRLEGRPSGDSSFEAAIAEFRAELDAIQERLDFVERALVAEKKPSDRPLPPNRDRDDEGVRTPP